MYYSLIDDGPAYVNDLSPKVLHFVFGISGLPLASAAQSCIQCAFISNRRLSLADLQEKPITMATDSVDDTDYDNLTELVQKKMAKQKRFVTLDERKDDSLMSTETFQLLLRGKLPFLTTRK